MEIPESPDRWEMMEWMVIEDFKDNLEAEENPALLFALSVLETALDSFSG